MLLDHFSGALEQYRDWHGFHQAWAIMLAADLNQRLPEEWFAEPIVQFQLETDVAALNVSGTNWSRAVDHSAGVTATEWSPPEPTAVLDLPGWVDVVAVEIYAPDRPRRLVGAIELVSPSNKDRPESREAFVAKCERYLQTELGLVVIAIVTERRADLHAALLERLDPEAGSPIASRLFACSYAPCRQDERLQLRLWHTPLTVGQPLPTLPFVLKDGPTLPLNLEESYQSACRTLRIPLV